MNAQWDCIRQNIGTWHGSFTKFSPQGEQLKDTPSVLTLEETEPGEKIKLTLERTPPGESTDTVHKEFSAPGPAPYVYFFESGAFSQGSLQWAAFSQFGAEMSIKVEDRRARFVIMYESNSEGTSKIKYVTLIRETQTDGTQFDEPSLSLKQLSGKWAGDVQVLHASMDPLSEGSSEWQLENSTLISKETFDEAEPSLSLSGEFELEATDGKPVSLEGDLTYQLMPLPNGIYCLLPQTIRKGEAFRIEAGWLRKSGAQFSDGDVLRSRLIRYYDSQGVWTHTALIEDQRATQ